MHGSSDCLKEAWCLICLFQLNSALGFLGVKNSTFGQTERFDHGLGQHESALTIDLSIRIWLAILETVITEAVIPVILGSPS